MNLSSTLGHSPNITAKAERTEIQPKADNLIKDLGLDNILSHFSIPFNLSILTLTLCLMSYFCKPVLTN